VGDVSEARGVRESVPQDFDGGRFDLGHGNRLGLEGILNRESEPTVASEQFDRA
jgi:hypothetical protein